MTEQGHPTQKAQPSSELIDAKHKEAAKQLEKPNLPVQIFQTLERRDEDQILAEMRGELMDDLVYSIEIQGRRDRVMLCLVEKEPGCFLVKKLDESPQKKEEER